jgi:hypothetical protein
MTRYCELNDREMYGIYEYFPGEDGVDLYDQDPMIEAESFEDLKNHLYLMIDDMERFGVKEW